MSTVEFEIPSCAIFRVARKYIVSAMMLTVASISWGEILFSDDFSAPDSGTGWQDTWVDTGDAGEIREGTFAVTNGRAYRSFANNIDTTTADFWLVARLTIEGTATAGYAGLVFHNGSTEDLFIGSNTGTTVWRFYTGDIGGQSSTVEMYTGLETLLVMHIGPNAISMWIDPSDTSSEAALGTPDKSLAQSSIAGQETWNQLRIGCGSTITVTVDELLAATTFAEALLGATAPAVTMTSPVDGTLVTETPASVRLAAEASDVDGVVTQVEFFNGSSSLGVDDSAPYELALTGLAAGNYAFSAVATDSDGLTGASEPVAFYVGKFPPAVSLTSPDNSSILDTPATILLSTATSDVDGSVTQVEFFNGTESLGVVTEAPFEMTLDAVPPGYYVYLAKATDNDGLTTTSDGIFVYVRDPLSVDFDIPGPGGRSWIHEMAPASTGSTFISASLIRPSSSGYSTMRLYATRGDISVGSFEFGRNTGSSEYVIYDYLDHKDGGSSARVGGSGFNLVQGNYQVIGEIDFDNQMLRIWAWDGTQGSIELDNPLLEEPYSEGFNHDNTRFFSTGSSNANWASLKTRSVANENRAWAFAQMRTADFFEGSYSEDFSSMSATEVMPAQGWLVYSASGDADTWSREITEEAVSQMTVAEGLLTVATDPSDSNDNAYNATLSANQTDRMLASAPEATAGTALQLELNNVSGRYVDTISIAYDIVRMTSVTSDEDLPGYQLFYSQDYGDTWIHVRELDPVSSGPGDVVVSNDAGVNHILYPSIKLGHIWKPITPLLLRWVDDNASGNEPEQVLGLDNVAIDLGAALFTDVYEQDFASMGTDLDALPSGWSVLRATGNGSTWTDSIDETLVAEMTAVDGAVSIATSPTQSNDNGYNAAREENIHDRMLASAPNASAGAAFQLSLFNSEDDSIETISLSYDIVRLTEASTSNELPGYQLFYSLDNGVSWIHVEALDPTIDDGGDIIVPESEGVSHVAESSLILDSSWNPDTFLLLRWVDDNASQSNPDQILGLDNVVLGRSGGIKPYLLSVSPSDDAKGESTASVPLSVNVDDRDSSSLTVKFYGRKLGEAADFQDFSIAVLPDTQIYTENLFGFGDQIFSSQTDWIVAEREHEGIEYVIHLGDVVQYNGTRMGEWNIATNAMYTLEDTTLTGLSEGVPYTVTIGNHDQYPNSDADGTTFYWNTFFGIDPNSGVSHFEGKSYYGGTSEPTLADNNYNLFSAGGLDFVVISLEYDTTPDTADLLWADSILKAYPDRFGIVATHYALDPGNPGAFSSMGQALYDELKDNPNFIMMLGGHTYEEGRRSDYYEGNIVHTMLSDYQARVNGGNGWMRIMYFHPWDNRVDVRTYSPWLDQYETDDNSQFSLDVNLTSGLNSAYTLLDTVEGAPGTFTYNWEGLEEGVRYEWYAEVSDGDSNIVIPARAFLTEGAEIYPEVEITSPVNGSDDYSAPATILLSADASDSDGSVAQVEFFSGTESLGVDDTAPYELGWENVAIGSYTIFARATDNEGLVTTSSPISVVVNAPPPSSMDIAGPTGRSQNYEILPLDSGSVFMSAYLLRSSADGWSTMGLKASTSSTADGSAEFGRNTGTPELSIYDYLDNKGGGSGTARVGGSILPLVSGNYHIIAEVDFDNQMLRLWGIEGDTGALVFDTPLIEEAFAEGFTSDDARYFSLGSAGSDWTSVKFRSVPGDEISRQIAFVEMRAADLYQGSSYSEDFSEMGTEGTMPAKGWLVLNAEGNGATWTNSIDDSALASMTVADQLLTASDAPTVSKDSGYNAALASNLGDRMLASAPTTTAGTAFQLELNNLSGEAIETLSVAYDIVRLTTAETANELPGFQFYYSMDYGQSWTHVSELDPVLNGSAEVVVPNSTGVTHVTLSTLTLQSTWEPNASLLLRWVDDNAVETETDQIIGLDNVFVGAVQSGDLPVVSIAATDDQGGEFGDTELIFTVTRTGDVSQSLGVFYMTGGDAVSGGDYIMLSGELEIPAFAASADIPVTVLSDDEAEGDESLVVTLSRDSDYQLGTALSARVIIKDRPWQAYLYENAITGAANGDYDNDGTENLLEYYLGTRGNDNSSIPVVKVNVATEGSIKVGYTHRVSASDVAFSFEWSTDLESWYLSGESNGTLTVSVVPENVNASLGEDLEMVEATLSVTDGEVPVSIFIRLVVSE